MIGELVCFLGCKLIDIYGKFGFQKGCFIGYFEQKINFDVSIYNINKNGVSYIFFVIMWFMDEIFIFMFSSKKMREKNIKYVS